ncbi:hypothetical protein SeMB42_g02225 [Synchytrium endobioticum]|uniref:PH domain-containing protein n=1 Tax=Synchytrium endobioticum TaxID=286115 RepID=A0A507DGZ6_9FUNG|nr:hypothetical protein SeLEV6574_g07011 [Synchytrium endobioticum]TPX50507.1 hypothetical protein SeMB42_g02225 [Synchytrium endobioticum]
MPSYQSRSVSVPNLRGKSPLSPSQHVAGYMYKQCHTNTRRWVKRHFRWDGTTLSYHHSSSTNAESRWSVGIEDIKEIVASSNHGHMDNVFVVRLQGGCALECAALTRHEMDGWITILSRAVNAQWVSNMQRCLSSKNSIAAQPKLEPENVPQNYLSAREASESKATGVTIQQRVAMANNSVEAARNGALKNHSSLRLPKATETVPPPPFVPALQEQNGKPGPKRAGSGSIKSLKNFVVSSLKRVDSINETIQSTQSLNGSPAYIDEWNKMQRCSSLSPARIDVDKRPTRSSTLRYDENYVFGSSTKPNAGSIKGGTMQERYYKTIHDAPSYNLSLERTLTFGQKPGANYVLQGDIRENDEDAPHAIERGRSAQSLRTTPRLSIKTPDEPHATHSALARQQTRTHIGFDSLLHSESQHSIEIKSPPTINPGHRIPLARQHSLLAQDPPVNILGRATFVQSKSTFTSQTSIRTKNLSPTQLCRNKSATLRTGSPTLTRSMLSKTHDSSNQLVDVEPSSADTIVPSSHIHASSIQPSPVLPASIVSASPPHTLSLEGDILQPIYTLTHHLSTKSPLSLAEHKKIIMQLGIDLVSSCMALQEKVSPDSESLPQKRTVLDFNQAIKDVACCLKAYVSILDIVRGRMTKNAIESWTGSVNGPEREELSLGLLGLVAHVAKIREAFGL